LGCVKLHTDYYKDKSLKGLSLVWRNDENLKTHTVDYRFGFNGKEQDNEGMGGGGSTYDYGFRIYNPALGRFLSVDPLAGSFPFYTPYQYSGNKPIWKIDLDGLEESSSKANGEESWVGGKRYTKTEITSEEHAAGAGKTDDGGVLYRDNRDRKNRKYWKLTPGYKPPASEAPEESCDDNIEYNTDIGTAVFVAFPKAKAKIGSGDNSPIAQMARKYGMADRSWPVGHTGLVLINNSSGETVYTDFGRFSGHSPGNGITRFGLPSLSIDNAIFSADGSLSNANDMMKSLVGNGYFANHNYGGLLTYSSMTNLSFSNMSLFASGFGQATFGFGSNKSYCTDFACKTLLRGGATLKSYDIMALMNRAQIILNKKALPLALPEIMILLKSGPTGSNIVNDIKNANPSMPSGRLKY
jgi:RHS repeat-associated protein